MYFLFLTLFFFNTDDYQLDKNYGTFIQHNTENETNGFFICKVLF